MSSPLLIINGFLVNQGKTFIGHIYVENQRIVAVFQEEETLATYLALSCQVIDARGCYVLPGVIDDQVHFRDPGLTHKGDLYTESKAAIAGGITSFMDMPNTVPNTITRALLEEKYTHASYVSLANYSFYMGATNDNIEEIKQLNPKEVCGVKVFMGSSTGNMLVDNLDALERLFAASPVLVATHCEDEPTIQANMSTYKNRYGDDVPISCHPMIRSEEACYLSSSLAVSLAKKHQTRLHVLHLSTQKELALFDNSLPLAEKKITNEVCVHHLWFNQEDYAAYGVKIKWNPAIKTEQDRVGLLAGLLSNKVDVVATDHAPHLWAEKQNTYFKSASGGPLVQHSLVVMLELVAQQQLSMETVVEKMCHAPAICFQVEDRGFLTAGYFADIVIVEKKAQKVTPESLLYKCGWSPFEGQEFQFSVRQTIVNGHLVYNKGEVNEGAKGMRLTFNR